MKKVAVGCLTVLAIAMVGFAVAGYYAYRWAQPMMESTSDYFDKAREVARLSDRVANKSPYVPPRDGELTPSQVDRFLAVHSRVRDELGQRWAEIEAKSAQLQEKTSDGRALTFTEFTSVFSDLASIYLEARREQVTALNVHKFSDAEYLWVRLRVYEAAGLEITSGMDLSKIQQMAKENGMTLDVDKMPKPDVPAANRKLIKPHLPKLKESLPLAVLGL
ncbi:MAG TPA: hypothetical protein VJ691_13150 [Vicinamibacterales bacterium]|nr:hypothetical protein [Vicinamibacterales bacterium]